MDDDFTREERRLKWLAEKEADRERGDGSNLRVGCMKTWVNRVERRRDELREEWREQRNRVNGSGEQDGDKGTNGEFRERREKE